MRNPQKVDADLMFAVALRGQVVFPGTAVSLDIGRPRSINAVKQAMEKDQRLFVVAQKDVLVENPGPEDLYEIGTVVKIRHIVPSPNGQLRILVEGEQRALFTTMYDENEVLEMEVLPYDDAPYAATPEIIASTRVLTELAVRVLSAKNGNVAELKQALNGTQDPSVLCDVAVAAVVDRIEARQQILECERVDRRLDMAIGFAAEEVELQALQDQIQKRVHEAMDKANHDYYLREEMRVIQEELNEDEDEDIAALRKRVKASKMPDEVRERVEKELKRLARTAAQAPESAISENYIEYILELPWGVYDETEIDVKKARKVLEADHYGMREVKDR
ncbi:MAG: LON peptidase substrate-binding domain-containing protein, partial [Clostridia bacterium]|nr:LON peptidase substrate-binding domain-containing protein [Clostridia bacterium]